MLLLSGDITLANSAVRAEMETRNVELARVSECEGRRGRARKVNDAYNNNYYYNAPGGEAIVVLMGPRTFKSNSH